MRPLILALSCLFPLVSDARPDAASRTCRILFLAAPADAPKTLHLFDGTSSREVVPGRMSFSPVYELPAGDITLALTTEPPDPKPESGASPVPAGAPKASIRESLADFYLILSSDPENKVAPVRIQVIDAGGDKFRRGQMMWYNLTDHLVGGAVGSRSLRLKPQSRIILDAPASGLEEYPVNIQHMPPGTERAEPLCQTKWSHDPRARSLFFVLKEPGRLAPRIIGIPDFREDAGDDT